MEHRRADEEKSRLLEALKQQHQQLRAFLGQWAAEMLTLSPKTVETYRSRMMQKLGISDLPALVKFAIQRGLTSLE